jgi:uncharacterized protein (DUF58 family)
MKNEKELLSKKELLDIFVNHRANSPFPGDWESVFKGTGYEFWSLRALTASDPFKNIDWKAKAKTGKYYVREYLTESDFNLMILYDISKSVAFGRKELLQANIAVSLAYTAVRGNNGCGLILFADDVIRYIPPRMGWAHFQEIVSVIAEAAPVNCKETNLQAALTRLVSEIPESLSFILSDFMYTFECAHSFRGTSRHEVNALQILEEFEMSLPPDSAGLISLYDYESGAPLILDLSKWKIYNEQMKKKLECIKDRLDTAGIDLLRLTPSDSFILKIKEFMNQTR